MWAPSGRLTLERLWFVKLLDDAVLGEAKLDEVEHRVPESKSNVLKFIKVPSRLTMLYLPGGMVNDSAPLPKLIVPPPLDVIWLAWKPWLKPPE